MSSPIEKKRTLKKDKEYPNFFNACSKDTKILNTKSIYKHYPDINNNEIRQDNIISSRSQIIKSGIRPDISKIKNELGWVSKYDLNFGLNEFVYWFKNEVNKN